MLGDSGIPPVSVSAKGIGPLKSLADSIFLADGNPMVLEWVSPSIPNVSTISVMMDLSFHGGTRGKIECEGPDNGRLEIAAYDDTCPTGQGCMSDMQCK